MRPTKENKRIDLKNFYFKIEWKYFRSIKMILLEKLKKHDIPFFCNCKQQSFAHLCLLIFDSWFKVNYQLLLQNKLIMKNDLIVTEYHLPVFEKKCFSWLWNYLVIQNYISL